MSLLSKNIIEGKGFKIVAATFEELILKLYPMKSDTMEAAFKAVHQHDDRERSTHEHIETKQHANITFANKTSPYRVIEEYLCQLSMSQ
jgi:hypothetical protein